MSMPHECKCGICGRVMSPMFLADWTNPRFTGAAQPPAPGSIESWCTKHGKLDGLTDKCPHCVAESVPKGGIDNG